MPKGLFDLILLEEDNKEVSLKKRKLYKEYEEAVKKFLEDGANTDKIKDMEAATAKYCNDYVDLLNIDELVNFLLDKLLNNIKNEQMNKQINLIIDHAVFLGKISTLYTMLIKKQEEIRKNQEYRKNIEQICGLKELLKKIKEDNIPFEHLCEITHIGEEKLNCILNRKTYFNVRAFRQQKFVSLTPEGKKLQKYLKHIESKRYSQEEVENYIYMNSHRLINMFRQPNGNLPKSVTVIPLSDARQKGLSFEFKYAYNEISLKQPNIELDFMANINGISLEQLNIRNFDTRTRRNENAEPNIAKLKEFSRVLGKNIANSRLQFESFYR